MDKLGLALTSQGQTWFGVLVDSNDLLIASAFSENRNAVERHLSNYSEKVAASKPTPLKSTLAEDMRLLFNGQTPSRKVPYDTKNVTTYQNSVYKVLAAIPKGSVTTYGQISRKLKSGPRAVGNAVGSNPWPLFIPCHRVVPFNMTVGNYSSLEMRQHGGPVTKKALLEREGIRFQGEKILASEIWNP